MGRLGYRDCVECIDTIFRRAAEDKGLPVSAAIADEHGDLIAFGRMDGAPIRSITLSRDKAFTSIFMDRDTHEFRDMMTKLEFDVTWFGNSRLTPLPGGLRIADDRGCAGAIGVSGRLAEHDQELAQLGVALLRQRLGQARR